jgi:hypothetical protein
MNEIGRMWFNLCACRDDAWLLLPMLVGLKSGVNGDVLPGVHEISQGVRLACEMLCQIRTSSLLLEKIYLPD